jgi:hypothetical protein
MGTFSRYKVLQESLAILAQDPGCVCGRKNLLLSGFPYDETPAEQETPVDQDLWGSRVPERGPEIVDGIPGNAPEDPEIGLAHGRMFRL